MKYSQSEEPCLAAWWQSVLSSSVTPLCLSSAALQPPASPANKNSLNFPLNYLFLSLRPPNTSVELAATSAMSVSPTGDPARRVATRNVLRLE